MSQDLDLSHSFFTAGQQYVTSAHAIVKSRIRARYADDKRFILPCMMLIGHALEVYLKAWLAFHGHTKDQLRNDFGHDLRKLYETARTKGLPEPTTPPRLSFHDLVESYEADHRDLAFRYPTDGRIFIIPKIDLIFQILADLDPVVAAEIGVTPDSLDWSVQPDEDFRA